MTYRYRFEIFLLLLHLVIQALGLHSWITDTDADKYTDICRSDAGHDLRCDNQTESPEAEAVSQSLEETSRDACGRTAELFQAESLLLGSLGVGRAFPFSLSLFQFSFYISHYHFLILSIFTFTFPRRKPFEGWTGRMPAQ